MVKSLSPDKAAPQAAEMATVRWTAAAAGGVGERAFEFRVHDGKEEKATRKGASGDWDWSPDEPGSYRVMVVARDSIGNTVEGKWSPEYVVVPKLALSSLSPDKAAPQAAEMATVWWTAAAAGGVGERAFEFRVHDGKVEKPVQKGPSPTWAWNPRESGRYRVKVVVRDSIGNTVEGGWSSDYQIDVPVGEKSLIAVMPMENLAGTAVPLKELMKSLRETMKSKGLNVLEEDVLVKFMERHRVRYVGGLPQGLGKVFREETGTKAVLFLSFDLYDEAAPPKIALTARLVSTGQKTVILWADDVEMAGNDAPGFLGLGMIRDSRVLWGIAGERLVNSLTGYLAGRKLRNGHPDGTDGPGSLEGMEGRYRPKSYYKGTLRRGDGEEPLRIAVLPFLDESPRRNAGEIMALHFIRHLSGQRNLVVIEPGEVRQALLASRTIMEGGLSLPQAEVLRFMLGADLLLTGDVSSYEDYVGPRGNPYVNFSVHVFDMQSKRVTWSSISDNRGDDGVFFFDMGKVNTSHALASAMARAVADRVAIYGQSP